LQEEHPVRGLEMRAGMRQRQVRHKKTGQLIPGM
jgi:hypothetical protein